ncbi:MAG: BTAD domain-containing putative transcriptional regulator [Longimicrobiales bacterium]
MTTQLITLDELRCVHNGADTDLPAQKFRFALLVYLGMERSAPREKVAALFYPEVDQERARHRLSQSVYVIRQTLGTDCIETRGEELRARDSLVLDARDFGTLADVGEFGRALALYRRPFLDGFFLDDADEWERWAERKRAILSRTYAQAARSWITTLCDRQEQGAAIAQAMQWLEFDERNEDAHRLLMTALAQAGRRTDALAHFDAWERRLREEEGVKPPEALRKVAEEMRSPVRTPAPISTPVVLEPPQPTPPVHLEPRLLPAPHTTRRSKHLLGFVGLVLLTIAIAISVTTVWMRRSNEMGATASDSTRFAIMPFRYGDARTPQLHGEQLLQDALGAWEGLTTVDYWQVHSALATEQSGRLDITAMTPAVAARAARRTGATRMLVGEVARLPDSLRVQLTLYDVRTRRHQQLRLAARRIALDGSGAEAALNEILRELLFGSSKLLAGSSGGTRSYPALSAFAHGQEAIGRWALPAAESAFFQASREDPGFVHAALWLAQTRMWNQKDPAQWRYAAEIAADKQDRLSARDKLLAQALLAFARDERPRACGLYKTATDLESSDFTSWYSYGECLAGDNIVVPDASSPSGFAFRSGYHSAVVAFERAFQLTPSVHQGLAVGLYSRLRSLLMTNENSVRPGRGLPPDSNRFRGFVYWSVPGDSLAVIPYTAAELAGVNPPAAPAAEAEALRRRRQLFLNIATRWRIAFPQSTEAVIALAVGLDMYGDATAADTLALARTLSSSRETRQYLTAVEAILRLKHAVPYHPERIRVAAALADSALGASHSARTSDAMLMASLAALRGRPTLVLAYLQSAGSRAQVPSQINGLLRRLTTYASFGTPVDSIVTLARALTFELPKVPDATLRQYVISSVGRASALAFSVVHQDLSTMADGAYYAIDAQRAFARGDTQQVRTILQNTLNRRQAFGLTISLDGAPVEAWLWSAIGQPATARNLLDATLLRIPLLAPDALTDPVIAASMVKAMAMRAQLADSAGASATARSWAKTVVALWENAEPLLSSEVKRVRLLADQDTATR